jgi:hypothetical protein
MLDQRLHPSRSRERKEKSLPRNPYAQLGDRYSVTCTVRQWRHVAMAQYAFVASCSMLEAARFFFFSVVLKYLNSKSSTDYAHILGCDFVLHPAHKTLNFPSNNGRHADVQICFQLHCYACKTIIEILCHCWRSVRPPSSHVCSHGGADSSVSAERQTQTCTHTNKKSRYSVSN